MWLTDVWNTVTAVAFWEIDLGIVTFKLYYLFFISVLVYMIKVISSGQGVSGVMSKMNSKHNSSAFRKNGGRTE